MTTSGMVVEQQEGIKLKDGAAGRLEAQSEPTKLGNMCLSDYHSTTCTSQDFIVGVATSFVTFNLPYSITFAYTIFTYHSIIGLRD